MRRALWPLLVLVAACSGGDEGSAEPSPMEPVAEARRAPPTRERKRVTSPESAAEPDESATLEGRIDRMISSVVQNGEAGETAWRAADMLEEIGLAAVDPLVDLVETNPHPGVRAAACYALSNTPRRAVRTASGQRALRALIAWVEEPDPNEEWRNWARSGLLSMASSAGPAAAPVLPDLERLARHDDAYVRQAGVLALMSLGRFGRDALPALAAAARDADRDVRFALVRRLPHFHPADGALDPIVAVLAEDEDAEIRKFASGVARLLERARRPRPPLEDEEDPTERIRRESAGRWTGPPAGGGPEGPEEDEEEEEEEPPYEVPRNASVEQLAALLGEYESREAAARELARRGASARAALPALIAALGDYSPRVDIVLALGAVGGADPAVVRELIEVVEDVCEERNTSHSSDDDLPPVGALALGRLGPAARAALPALRDALEARDARLRSAAAWAIRRIDR